MISNLPKLFRIHATSILYEGITWRIAVGQQDLEFMETCDWTLILQHKFGQDSDMFPYEFSGIPALKPSSPCLRSMLSD